MDWKNCFERIELQAGTQHSRNIAEAHKFRYNSANYCCQCIANSSASNLMDAVLDHSLWNHIETNFNWISLYQLILVSTITITPHFLSSVKMHSINSIRSFQMRNKTTMNKRIDSVKYIAITLMVSMCIILISIFKIQLGKFKKPRLTSQQADWKRSLN